MKKKGVTLVEVVIVIAISGILASAFVTVMVPMMNFYFYYPESSRVNNAAMDVLQIILKGDNRAKGLRFTGKPCTIPTGGAIAITAASATSVTYNYAMSDNCGTGGANDVTVVLTYDSGNHIVTRAIDGGAAVEIPSYATAASGIKIDAPSGVSFFRYFDSAGTEMTGGGIVVTSIYRVDITVNATSGTGVVKHSAGQILMKGAVEIKRYVA